MEKYHIKLTDEEQVIVDEIDFESFTHESYLANQEPILTLLSSLSERGAIPEQRLKYWNDPEYNTGGRGKISHLVQFEKNGNVDNEVYTHPHFLKYYLGYFLFGTDLPDGLIEMFEADVEKEYVNLNYVTSSDITPICRVARKVARIAIRQCGLSKSHVAEEFFRLCLDTGLGISYARIVRKNVMRIR